MSSRSTSPALSVLNGEGYQEGQEVPAPPVPAKAKSVKGDAEGPGVVYVGYLNAFSSCRTRMCANHNLSHIPHGFYEHQMRAYFSQFGPITRLRLSRNRTTGASKHYAFIEFASAEVASIVASTMNSYLLFGHILRCKVMPPEQVHEKLWVGANRRFKTVPWNRIEGRKLKLPMGREAWERRVQMEKKRREKKNKGLQSIGYEGPEGALREVRDLPIRQQEEDKSNKEVAALKPGSPTRETIPEEKTAEEKNADEGSGDGLAVNSQVIKTSKVRRVKRKGKISDLEQEDKRHREGSTSILEDPKSESRPSKRKADKEKASAAKKVRRKTASNNKDFESEPRISKRKADNDKVSASKKVQRKKQPSDQEASARDGAVTEA